MAAKQALAQQGRRLILSGIQPTGIPHLGNYLGALNNWVKLQQEPDATTYYMFADLHAITMPQDPATLRRNKLDMAASLLACGIDPKRSVLFEQSRVPGHADLMWVFNCLTPVGWLGRMTQWKSKMDASARGNKVSHAEMLADESLTTGLKMGLFDYPVLQAADILIYKATHVPVGEDQLQHLELARDIAKVFNKTFKSNTFPKPNPIIPQGTKRVMSLRVPTSKMSKSDPSDHSKINLTDAPELIQSKIRRAVTDSIQGVTYDVENRPGVSNLISIYSAVRDIEIHDAVKEFENVKSTQAFKDQVAAAVIDRLTPIQNELKRLQDDQGYVMQVLEEGATKASEVAAKNVEEVYKLMGLRL
ncbi:tryptophan-tRNA ligase [Lichtheimia ornata]|uniref:Tryptophan--tRNA ligase, mitochondrial n=1 Tax=Lichtheimia ornata TaxID=688661 RepID=A0AAD7V263_9FUNG|nr:tryptophan-tRNA ligase [Lichtheimia ornata]KAJ8656747.1 tryptophan-tRNA ligase [Lichtheimia ornata]